MSMMAHYSRIPTNYGLPSMVAEEVLRCPKCSDRLIPQLLDTNIKGEQNVWWVCAAMSEDPKSCNFPLAMPPNVYWVKRTPNDVRMNIIPRPKVKHLPKKYHHLYPGIFSSSGSSRGSHCSSLAHKRKTLTRSDGVSAGSSDSGHRPLTPFSNMQLEKSTTVYELAAIRDGDSVDISSTHAERSILPEVQVIDLPSTSTSIVIDEPISSQPAERQRGISPGIGDLFSTPQPFKELSQNAVEMDPSGVATTEKNTTDFQIAKDAKHLEETLKNKPGSMSKALKRNLNLRRTPTVAPAPLKLKASTPWEKTKAALTLMHSAPNEIPESFVQASRKLAVASGYKQRISQWNRNSAIESWKDEHQVKPPLFFKRSRGGADMLTKSVRHDMAVPKPEDGEMQHIEMEVHHKLAAKMMQHSYPRKDFDEINYLMRREYHQDDSSIPETFDSATDQETQFESMQPVKEEEMQAHVDWFNEVDSMDLSTYGGEQSTHWSTLTQASTSAPEVFSGAFEDPSNEDSFDDPFAWNGM